MQYQYAFLAFVGIVFVTYKVQKWIIYHGDMPAGSREVVDTPDAYGMPYEDVRLKTADGETLQVYTIVPADVRPKTVVMLGPNAGNIGHSLPLAQIFYERARCNVVMLSYRGYGRSTGSASEAGIKRDADALLAYLREDHKLRNTSVVLYGRSLGGAVAVYIAAQPAARGFIRALLLENTFLSISKLIPAVMPLALPLSVFLTERWESYRDIEKIDPHTAVLFLAGGRDELIPPAHFRQLFDICPATDKLYLQYPRGQHNDTCIQPGYWKDVNSFVARHVPPCEE